MPLYQPLPPGPYLGGRQPYDGPRKSTPPSTPRDNPPQRSVQSAIAAEVLRLWDAPPPLFVWYGQKVNAALASVPRDNPPLSDTLNAIAAEIYRLWDAPPPGPVFGVTNPQPYGMRTQLNGAFLHVPRDNPPPYRAQQPQNAALAWRNYEAGQGYAPPEMVQPGVVVEALVPYENQWLSGVLSAWAPATQPAQPRSEWLNELHNPRDNPPGAVWAWQGALQYRQDHYQPQRTFIVPQEPVASTDGVEPVNAMPSGLWWKQDIYQQQRPGFTPSSDSPIGGRPYQLPPDWWVQARPTQRYPQFTPEYIVVPDYVQPGTSGVVFASIIDIWQRSLAYYGVPILRLSADLMDYTPAVQPVIWRGGDDAWRKKRDKHYADEAAEKLALREQIRLALEGPQAEEIADALKPYVPKKARKAIYAELPPVAIDRMLANRALLERIEAAAQAAIDDEEEAVTLLLLQ